MPYIPHTEQDIQEMLTTIGIDSVAALFSEIPANLKMHGLKNIPPGMTEAEVVRLMEELVSKNKNGLCFIGAGAYDHYVPAVVTDLISRGELLTAYTPYQAEASQGTLQIIYEYQSMMSHLLSMDVSNASMYDGASALAEAVLMAVRVHKNPNAKKILVPRALHPAYRKVITTVTKPQQLEIIEIPFARELGNTPLANVTAQASQEVAALIISQPNFFGSLEEVDELTDWAHANNILVIGCVNPLAMSLLKTPGTWGTTGADIVVGDGQSLGLPMSCGGPYFGFMCCKKEIVRQMPGRLVGRTIDKDGKPGFVLTLQAREQHIRRAKATSNICSNQALMATAATIYMSLVGATGLKHIAAASHANATELLGKLGKIKGVHKIFSQPFFHEFVIQLPRPAAEVLPKLSAAGIQAGYNLTFDYPELGNSLLVCVTENKSAADLIAYVQQLEQAI